MLTDRTLTAPVRTRTQAPQLSRLLWLAALLFGLLFAHGLHGESAAGHLKAGVAASLLADGPESSADHDHHQHEDGQAADSAHDCAPGQPDEAPAAPPPGTSPTADHCSPSPRFSVRAVAVGPADQSPGATSVLRI